MKAVRKSEQTPSKLSVQNRDFWQSHIDSFKASGLMRSEYCRRNNINYYRFGYWVNKSSIKIKSLVEIKFKPAEPVSSYIILGSIELPNGKTLRIHNLDVLLMLTNQKD